MVDFTGLITIKKTDLDAIINERDTLKEANESLEKRLDLARDVTLRMVGEIVDLRGCTDVPYHGECFTDCRNVHGKPKQRQCVTSWYIQEVEKRTTSGAIDTEVK